MRTMKLWLHVAAELPGRSRATKWVFFLRLHNIVPHRNANQVTYRTQLQFHYHSCPICFCGPEMCMAPMPRHPRPQAAPAYTNAIAHPQRGHHRTTRCTSGSVRSPGSCRPHHRVRRPDTNAPGPRSQFHFLSRARHTSCRHSTRVRLQ
jgi:hypothetical protein